MLVMVLVFGLVPVMGGQTIMPAQTAPDATISAPVISKEQDAEDGYRIFMALQEAQLPIVTGGAPGGTITTTLLQEGFEGGVLPSLWSDRPGTLPWKYAGYPLPRSGAVPLQTPHGGTKAAYFDIYNYAQGTVDSLITPSMDFSGYTSGLSLEFWYGQNVSINKYDSVVVYLYESGTPGTFTRLGKPTTNSAWTKYTYPLTSTSTNARIYFIGYSDYGNYNPLLDDVWVGTPIQDDIAATSVTSPSGTLPSGALLTSFSYPVAGRFKNMAAAAQTFDARMVINNGVSDIYDNTVTGITLNPAESTTVTFPNYVPASGGTHTFTLTAVNPGDEVPANNIVSRAYTVYVHEGTGGPAGYYRWIDNTQVGGPVFNWVDLSAGATIAFIGGDNDDGSSVGLDMSGSFFFFGNNFSRVFANANGFLSFDTITALYYNNASIPTAATPNKLLAVWWDDLRVGSPYTGGAVKYLDDGTRFVVEYDSVTFYGNPTGGRADFQVILNRADSSITYQYRNINATAQTDATIGIENAAGTVGLSYFYSATILAGMGNFPQNGVAVKFYYLNQTPVLDPIGPKAVDEGASLQFVVISSDADVTPLTLSAVNLPANATFADSGNGHGLFTFSPDYTQASIYDVTFIVSDGILADSELVAITVNNVNRSPVLDPIWPKAVNAGTQLQFVVTSTDPDLDLLNLTAVGLPANAVFADSGNGHGLFTFNPDNSQVGIVNVRFIVSDESLADSEMVEITVNQVGYKYLPGDANMQVAAWPPQVNAADVQRMIAFFQGNVFACVFVNASNDTLWASADANGSCDVRASDVTRLVAFFKTFAPPPTYCPDFPPIAPDQPTYNTACTPSPSSGGILIRGMHLIPTESTR